MNQSDMDKYALAQEHLSKAIESIEEILSSMKASKSGATTTALFRKASKDAREARAGLARGATAAQGGTTWKVVSPERLAGQTIVADTYLSARSHFRTVITSAKLTVLEERAELRKLALRPIVESGLPSGRAWRGLKGAEVVQLPKRAKRPKAHAKKSAVSASVTPIVSAVEQPPATPPPAPVAMVKARKVAKKAEEVSTYTFTYKPCEAFTMDHLNFSKARSATGMTRMELAREFGTSVPIILGLEEGKYKCTWASTFQSRRTIG